MSERATIFQGVQLNDESVPGTAVAANKALSSISIEPSIASDFFPFRPLGSKFKTLVIQNREWSAGKITGVADYNEIPFLLESVCHRAAPGSLGGGVYSREYKPAARNPDDAVTYTIEQGGSVRAHKITYGIVTGLEIVFSRTGDGIALSGDLIGRSLQDGITMTAAPTYYTNQPMLPKDVTVYVDDTFGTLGDTDLARCLKATWRLTDRFNPVWVLNKADSSFVAIVEKEPTAQVELLVEADAEGMGILTGARAGDTFYCRIEVADDDTSYVANFDSAIKVSAISEFSDEDGVFAVNYTFDAVYDATAGYALDTVIHNKVASIGTES